MDYEINKETLVIIPTGENKCKVIENNNEYNIYSDGFSVVEHSCEYFGSSYEGRNKASKKFINAKYKIPIVIEESQKIVVFPTASCDSNECFWVALNNISNYYPSKNPKYSIIEFKNGSNIEINISYGSLQNQILRATRLQAVMNDRLEKA